jgi:glycosyltransferase involved in cell wall biosynthesis
VCYNHERFVADAIRSVLNQSYKNIELIVVDDGSTDNSVSVIKSMNVTLIDRKANKGYCSTFNEGWKACKGEFIIDLAGDDELPPDRVQLGVNEFQKRDDLYGVQFGDALYSDGHLHSKRFPDPSEGFIYTELIKRYFICAASMMSRRSVLTMLNGYDENLAYEDFDFWIRSSRHFKYFYTPEVLVKKRIVKGSMSEKQFERGNPQQFSTYKVCEKIRDLNKTREENNALRERLWYEIRHCIFQMDLGLARKYLQLLRTVH